MPYLERLSMALLTESSGGRVIANDGRDFAPGMPRALGWTETQRLRVVETLRQSLAFPHQSEDSDGYSTGPLQQISREAVTAGGMGSWGWGSIADTMSPARSALMFVEALRVTDDPIYRVGSESVALSDPVAADVLRTQQPALASARSSNYSAAQVAIAKRMARGGPRYFTQRADT